MIPPMRRHLSYANIAATLALVFAMSGGALAASHYLINSTKQINPKVLKKLKGNAGKTGATGLKGPAGPQGPAGANGQQGAEGPTGPSDVYTAGTAVKKLTETYVSYGQLVLPAGSYLVEAKATFFAESAGARMVCFLSEGISLKGELDGGDVSAEDKAQNVLTLIGAQTYTSPQTLELVCKLASGTEGTIDDAHMVAIRTGALHGSLPVD